eukprot:Rhum_TRINITY_DN14788_c25_g1::Rhum_TRINITY_DN14788_c25_g1_i1::g.119231::m.119231
MPLSSYPADWEPFCHLSLHTAPPPPHHPKKHSKNKEKRTNSSNNNNKGRKKGKNNNAHQVRRQREAEAFLRMQKIMEESPSNPYQFLPSSGQSQQEFLQQFKAEHSERMLRKGDVMKKFNEELASLKHDKPESKVERLDIPEILRLIKKNQVTFVVTETGSGKSTNVPKGLMDTEADVLIGTTQPRRTATINLATRVASLADESVGDSVGYWIRGERRGTEKTKLWYMTSYTLLLRLLSSPMKPPFTHIIIDEFHERQPDIEVTVALLRMCLLRGSEFKLVLMSATLNTEDWVSYFEGLSVGVYTESVMDHPIHNYYLEDCSTLCGLAVMPTKNFTPGAVASLVVDNALMVAQEVIRLIVSCSHPSHAILVFLPGRMYVDRFRVWVTQKMGNRLHPVCWHSMVELAQIQEHINMVPPNGKQKIYLATDIAEVSITLPDAVFVVDLCLVKRPHINPQVTPSLLFPPLVLQWVSHGSHQQRRGRVGRTQPGFYFSMLSEQHIGALPKYPVPPICHSRLDDLTLHLLQICSAPLCMYSLCRREPVTKAVLSALRSLVEAGCAVASDAETLKGEREEIGDSLGWSRFIMESNEESTKAAEAAAPEPVVCAEEDEAAAAALAAARAEAEETKKESQRSYDITWKGKLVQRLPVAVRNGMCMYYGALFEAPVTELMVIATAVTQASSVFVVEAKQTPEEKALCLPPNPQKMGQALEQCENVMKAHALDTSSDLICCISIYLHWRTFLESNENPDEEVMWCHANSVSLERLANLHDFVRHVRAELCVFLTYLNSEEPTPQELHDHLRRHKDTIVLLTTVANIDTGIRVTKEGSIVHKQKEGGVAYFLATKAVPDMHQASVCRWYVGNVMVCSNVTLRPGSASIIAGFVCDNLQSESHYFLIASLFIHCLRYKMQCDDAGIYVQMALTMNGVTKYVEVDEHCHGQILEFRKKLSKLMSLTKLRQEHGEMTEEEFEETLKDSKTSLRDTRKDVVAALHYDLLAPDSNLHFEEVDALDLEDDQDEVCTDYLRFGEAPPISPKKPALKPGSENSRGQRLLQEVAEPVVPSAKREDELNRRQSESLRKQRAAFESFEAGVSDSTNSPITPPFGMGMTGLLDAPDAALAPAAAAGGGSGGGGGVADPPPFGAFSSLVVSKEEAEDAPPELAEADSEEGQSEDPFDDVPEELLNALEAEAELGHFSPPPELEEADVSEETPKQ